MSGSMLTWRVVVCVRCGCEFETWRVIEPKGGWVCPDCKGGKR